MRKRGFSIRIFLPSGSADGLKLVEKTNWSGRGVICPRSVYPQSKKRHEFESTGIYVLVGPSEAGDVPTVYIGQGDPIRPRLDSHFAKKDFWTSAVFFVSKDDNLNKALIGHIEARLIQLAREVKRSELDNSNQPVIPSLSEMDEADAEGFLDEILLCLPIMGIDVFTKPQSVPRVGRFRLRVGNVEAEGRESADGFVVYAGARVRGKEADSTPGTVIVLRKNLLDRGVLTLAGDDYVLTQDYTFNSPSQAATTLMGRPANGRTEWKDKSGRTLKETQELQAKASR
jgi:hypothetical protein